MGNHTDTASIQKLPLYACSVQAGFPSPADDFLEGELIRTAATGTKFKWQMKHVHRSPAYTTRWTDLPMVR